MNLKNKKVLLVGWGCENPKDTYMYQIWYLILKKIFPRIKTFDTKKYYFLYGKEFMNNSLLKRLKEGFDLIIFAMDNDEISPEIFKSIKEKFQNLRLVLLVCDDDSRFDSWSRFYALFFDAIIQSPDMTSEYKKDGIEKAFFHLDYNTYKLRPIKLKKIYDVTFIGRPKADRNKVIKYLLDNGIKIKLFGWDWHKYPEFKDIYLGPLNQEDYVKVINQTKINLNFTKAGYSEEADKGYKHYNLKGRIFEIALCKSFQLIERFPTLSKFFNEKEIGMYSSNQEMLEKIKYYLKHEKKREEMAEKAYKKVLRNYNREKQLIKIFREVFKSKKIKKLPKSNKKIITLTKKNLDENDLKKKIEKVDYISFNINAKNLELKNFFLSRALEVTQKPIVCCDYYVSSLGLKDYMLFSTKFAFKRIGKEANKLIVLNQLMIKKDFFLENLSHFKKFSKRKIINLINEENTAFVSIPLIRIKKIKKIGYEKLKKAFEMKFPNKLLSLIHQKKIIINPYLYMLLLKSLFGNLFILRYLFEIIRDKHSKEQLLVNESYFEGSFFKKLIP